MRNEIITVFCICFIDVDFFKAINDKWSHNVGDIALIEISKIIEAEIRTVDYVGRWGGEEFIVLLTNSELEAAETCCERIRLAIEKYDCSNFSHGLNITISAGISQFTGIESINELINNADAALYSAKQSGRNKVIMFKQ